MVEEVNLRKHTVVLLCRLCVSAPTPNDPTPETGGVLNLQSNNFVTNRPNKVDSHSFQKQINKIQISIPIWKLFFLLDFHRKDKAIKKNNIKSKFDVKCETIGRIVNHLSILTNNYNVCTNVLMTFQNFPGDFETFSNILFDNN